MLSYRIRGKPWLMIADFKWDAFISHASEDKKSFVEPLAEELRKYGLEIWLDALTLLVGDSLRRSIDEGLAKSRFGIVILSPAFLAKPWPQHELDGLVALEMEGRKVILPVWHELTKSDLLKYSPTLADKVAARSSDGVVAVAKALIKVIRPEALRIPTSWKDASLAISRLQEQLKQNAPEFEYRITSAETISTVPLRYQSDPNKRLIGSSLTDGLKIDIIAPNAAAYDAKPLFAHATFTKAALDRLQEAHRTGDTVTFGPDEVSELKSELFRIVGRQSEVASIESLTVSTPAKVLAQRLRLRVTFVKDDLREEFSLIEFRFIKVGTERFQVESCHPPLPFQLKIMLPWQKGPEVLMCRFAMRATIFGAFTRYTGHYAFYSRADASSLWISKAAGISGLCATSVLHKRATIPGSMSFYLAYTRLLKRLKCRSPIAAQPFKTRRTSRHCVRLSARVSYPFRPSQLISA